MRLPGVAALRGLVAELESEPDTPASRAALAKVQAQVAALIGEPDSTAAAVQGPREIAKVGPKGYIHGWIFVGVPGLGERVHHPSHGEGTVIGNDEHGHVRVGFDSGATHTFENRGDMRGAPALMQRGAPAPGVEPLSARDSDDELRRKLEAHYLQMKKAEHDSDHATVDAIAEHHREHGIPAFADGGVTMSAPKAELATLVARLHASQHSGAPVPSLRIRPLTAQPGHNQHARENGVSAWYAIRDNLIEISPRTMRYNSGVSGTSGGFYADSGSAHYLQKTVTHEYGHMLALGPHRTEAVEPVLRRMKAHRELTAAIPGTDKHDPAYESLDAWVKRNQAAIINHVGTYAATNGDELMAELYTEHKLAPAPSKAAQIAGKYLEGG